MYNRGGEDHDCLHQRKIKEIHNGHNNWNKFGYCEITAKYIPVVDGQLRGSVETEMTPPEQMKERTRTS